MIIKNNKGITLITLVITIIILLILAGIAINLTLGDNGLFSTAKQAKEETLKTAATEKMNLKITNIQIDTYTKKERMPTLQEFSDNLCEDSEIEYVELQSKKEASLDKINVGEASSIFTKLKDYPYEFEINSSLQLASIDGVKVASNNDTVTISKDEYNEMKAKIDNIIDYSNSNNIVEQTVQVTVSANKWENDIQGPTLGAGTWLIYGCAYESVEGAVTKSDFEIDVIGFRGHSYNAWNGEVSTSGFYKGEGTALSANVWFSTASSNAFVTFRAIKISNTY
jgi:hypothetical protein